jgi:hypothetical protein
MPAPKNYAEAKAQLASCEQLLEQCGNDLEAATTKVDALDARVQELEKQLADVATSTDTNPPPTPPPPGGTSTGEPLPSDTTRPTFDDLLVCAANAYESAYASMSLVAAGGLKAFQVVGARMRQGPFSIHDCDPNNPFRFVPLVQHLGLLGGVEAVARELEGLVFDPPTGWPKVIRELYDEVVAYGKALCDCEDPIWAEARLLAAFLEVREWLVADWTASALAGAALLGDVRFLLVGDAATRPISALSQFLARGRFTGLLDLVDDCPPIGATNSPVERIARLAGSTPAEARALDQHFVRTTEAVTAVLDIVVPDRRDEDEGGAEADRKRGAIEIRSSSTRANGLPGDPVLRSLVTTFAGLAAFPVPLRFPLVKPAAGSSRPMYDRSGPVAGHDRAHPASRDEMARLAAQR